MQQDYSNLNTQPTSVILSLLAELKEFYVCRSIAAGAVGASLGGVPGQNSSNVANGLKNHVHSSTCSHNHQGHTHSGHIPVGLGNFGLPNHGNHDQDHTA